MQAQFQVQPSEGMFLWDWLETSNPCRKQIQTSFNNQGEKDRESFSDEHKTRPTISKHLQEEPRKDTAASKNQTAH